MSELTHQGAFRLIYQRRRTKAEQGMLQSHLQYCAECRQDAEMAGLFNDHLLLKELPIQPSAQFTAVFTENAARRSRRSQIMKPIYAVGGAAALALLMLAGWFIIRSNIQTTGLVEAPELPTISVSEPQASTQPAVVEEAVSQPKIDVAAVDQQLISAVEAGDAAEVERLLEAGANPDFTSNGTVPLPLAAGAGELEIVQLLLDAGADVNSTMDGRSPDLGHFTDATALHYAAREGKEEAIALLIEHGASLDIRNNEGQTPLDVAANEQIAELLREAGAVEESRAETAVGSLDEQLIEAVANKDAVLVNQLLNAGANPNTLDNEGSALLPLAANGGQLEIVRHLLDAGADINGTHSTNYAEEGTALLWAAVRDDIDVVRLLIANGADLDRPETDYNRSPLFGAAWYNNVEVIKILLESGADPNFHSNWGKGQTPLHYALSNSSQEAVQALVEGGADLDSQTDGGTTPLMMARNREMLTILLKGGANPDVQDNSGDTVLHRAALANNDVFVSILIEYGADVGIENLEGQTALDLATDDKIIEMLREAGASE